MVVVLNFFLYVKNISIIIERGIFFREIINIVELVCLGMILVDDFLICCLEILFVNILDEMIELVKDKKVDFVFFI